MFPVFKLVALLAANYISLFVRSLITTLFYYLIEFFFTVTKFNYLLKYQSSQSQSTWFFPVEIKTHSGAWILACPLNCINRHKEIANDQIRLITVFTVFVAPPPLFYFNEERRNGFNSFELSYQKKKTGRGTFSARLKWLYSFQAKNQEMLNFFLREEQESLTFLKHFNNY